MYLTVSEAIKLIPRSVHYDKRFLSSSYPKHFSSRLYYLLNKYNLLVKHVILNKPPIHGKTKVKVDNRWIFYESPYGLSNFQSMIIFFSHSLLKHFQPLNNPTIIDVGAHCGYFTLCSYHMLNKPKIYACEPLSLTYQLLKKNCQGLRSIKPIKIGLSDKRKKSLMYYEKSHLVYSSVFSERFTSHEKPQSESINLTTLDNITQKLKIKYIDILKIDTEGGEELVLDGARKSLKNTRFLVLECAMDRIRSYTFSSLISRLYTKDYNFQLINISNPLYFPNGNIVVIDLLLENINI